MSRPLLAACLFFTATVSTLHAHGIHFYTLPKSDFIKELGGQQVIDMIRSARKVEAVRVKLDDSNPKQNYNKRKLLTLGKPFEIDEKIAAQAKSILTDYNTFKTYDHAFSMCLFDPGVKITFYTPAGKNVTFLICIKCDQVAVSKDGQGVGFCQFPDNEMPIMELVAAIFPNDKEIRTRFEEARKSEKVRAREEEKESNRWIAAAPKPLRPILIETIKQDRDIDTKALRTPLEAGCPDKNKRILALMEWAGYYRRQLMYGTGNESVPLSLLGEYPAPDILTAMQSTRLSDKQKEGAFRMFIQIHHCESIAKDPERMAKKSKAVRKSLLDFIKGREPEKLPPALKQTLFDYCRKTRDPERIPIAREMFNL